MSFVSDEESMVTSDVSTKHHFFFYLYIIFCILILNYAGLVLLYLQMQLNTVYIFLLDFH